MSDHLDICQSVRSISSKRIFAYLRFFLGPQRKNNNNDPRVWSYELFSRGNKMN